MTVNKGKDNSVLNKCCSYYRNTTVPHYRNKLHYKHIKIENFFTMLHCLFDQQCSLGEHNNSVKNIKNNHTDAKLLNGSVFMLQTCRFNLYH